MMKKIKILLTASGAPGCSTLIRKLKENGEREVEIVAVDQDEEIIGEFWADKFYKVPSASEENYISALEKIIKKESPDLFFPVSSDEVLSVAKNRKRFEDLGTKVMVSDAASIETAVNKYNLYTILREHDIPVPDFCYPKSLDAFVQAVKKLGYPEKSVCFKPHIGKGSRGFRILDESISRKDLLLKYKPISLYMNLAEFIEIFKNEKDFPDFLVMEKVEGLEYDAMSLCYEGESLLTTIKTREKSRWGIITLGELIDNNEIVRSVGEIISIIPLSFNISLQFIGNKLIEINPRTSTFIYQDDLNEPYLAVKLCLGEIDKEEVAVHRSNIRYGRKMIRYMDQIFWDKSREKFDN